MLGLLGLLASFVHPGSSVVRIELDASWPAHDLLHEALFARVAFFGLRARLMP